MTAATLSPWRSPALRWWLVLVLLATMPLLARGEFVLFMASQICIYFLVALGLNLLAGYGGQLSLGHGALMAIGAYTTAIATVDHGLSFWLALPLAVAITAGAGALMALPALAVHGASPAAYDRRCIPAGGVAPHSNTPATLNRRALPSGRRACLGATRD